MAPPCGLLGPSWSGEQKFISAFILVSIFLRSKRAVRQALISAVGLCGMEAHGVNSVFLKQNGHKGVPGMRLHLWYLGLVLDKGKLWNISTTPRMDVASGGPLLTMPLQVVPLQEP